GLGLDQIIGEQVANHAGESPRLILLCRAAGSKEDALDQGRESLQRQSEAFIGPCPKGAVGHARSNGVPAEQTEGVDWKLDDLGYSPWVDAQAADLAKAGPSCSGIDQDAAFKAQHLVVE